MGKNCLSIRAGERWGARVPLGGCAMGKLRHGLLPAVATAQRDTMACLQQRFLPKAGGQPPTSEIGTLQQAICMPCMPLPPCLLAGVQR